MDAANPARAIPGASRRPVVMISSSLGRETSEFAHAIKTQLRAAMQYLPVIEPTHPH
jgi:hypothetical protein